MAESSEISNMTSNASSAANTSNDGAGIPDAAVVSLADAVSHALENQPSSATIKSEDQQQESEPPPQLLGPPPQPLPTGWVMRESLSQPNYYYFYNMETGEATWHSPVIPQQQSKAENTGPDLGGLADAAKLALKDVAAAAAAAVASTKSSSERSSRKRSHHHTDDKHNNNDQSSRSATSSGGGGGGNHTSSNKKSKTSSSSSSTSSGNGGKPSKVRILHILKKHKDSRRPSSWRQPKITATKEEATEELQGLIEILQEEESGEAQRATFEELARTESDCSSAKRGGDLGFFGPKKMQPKFEEASFALKIGQLSGIVETSSGVHVLLRIG